MTISRISWLQFLCAILIVLLLVEIIESRPPKKVKKRLRPKHCGNEGHPCQSGSRKLCCNAGFTCRIRGNSNKTKQQKRRRMFGICKPVIPREKEIEESHSTPAFRRYKQFI